MAHALCRDLAVAGAILALCGSASAAPFSFSTGSPDGGLASGSRPAGSGKLEIETADDFVLNTQTRLINASFTGLLTGGATTADIAQVLVEIYRVFPLDSVNPPAGQVPTRVNSPSDIAFATRASGASELSFATSVLNASFSTVNSVLNGINPVPNQTTGGEGPVRGQEIRFDVTLAAPFVLDAGHYFFIPQVTVTGGEFMWLSAPKPITGGSGPFSPDLQSWIRNGSLAPDWLRIGTDIVGGSPAPTFNAAFSLNGETVPGVPEPSTYGLMLGGLAGLGWVHRQRGRSMTRRLVHSRCLPG